jgi:Ca-activated chloride channel family protein
MNLLSPDYLLLIVPALCLIYYLFLKDLLSLNSALARILLFFAVLFLLTQPVKEEFSSEEEVIALYDQSSSISPAARQELISSLGYLFDSEQRLTVNVLPFAAGVASNFIPIKSREDLANLQSKVDSLTAKLDRGETNLAKAINDVAGKAESAAVLVLSDGFETVGDALQEAKASSAKKVRLFPLIPNPEVFGTAGVRFASLYAPAVVHAGDLAEVQLSLRNTSNKEQTKLIKFYIDNQEKRGEEIVVPAQTERLVTFKTTALEGGLHQLKALLFDTINPTQIDEIHRTITAKARSRLFLLSGEDIDERVLKQLLTLKGYALEAINLQRGDKFPQSLDEAAGIIFNNVPKDKLPAGFLEQLEQYVTRGGGLLLLGGDKSFGLGGYVDTILDKLSPVKFLPPQTTKRRLTNAVVLLIDKSRSMLEENKIGAARSAAMVSIQAMKDEDEIGVIGFDSAPFVIVRLSPARDVKPIAQQRIGNLIAAGRTDLLPALAAARQSLVSSQMSRKHIIILSDGKMPLAGDAYVQEIARLRSEGITVSTVALGIEADAPFLQMLSQYGKGAFYQTLDASRLPEIFVKDIKLNTGEKTLQEQDAAVIVGPDGVITTSITSYPALKGFVKTEAKRDAKIELVTRAEERTLPVLAHWRYKNAGMVVAFTSDANGRWSFPWLNWEGFPRFWSQVIEHIEHAPDSSSGDIDFDLRHTVHRKTLTLDLAIFDPKLQNESSPRVSAQLTMPSAGNVAEAGGVEVGEVRAVQFLPGQKGRFIAKIDNVRPGDYKIAIQYGKAKLPPVGITLSGDLFGESVGKGINVALLSELAHQTGGVINPELSQLASSKRVTKKVTPQLHFLAVIAFFLLLCEVLFRQLTPAQLKGGITALCLTLLQRKK